MAPKNLRFDTDARRALEAGVNKLAEAVEITLGPKDQYVVLHKALLSPTITTDGVTIAQEIDLKDIFENQAAQMVKEVAHKPTPWPATARLRRSFSPTHRSRGDQERGRRREPGDPARRHREGRRGRRRGDKGAGQGDKRARRDLAGRRHLRPLRGGVTPSENLPKPWTSSPQSFSRRILKKPIPPLARRGRS